ncbi:FAD:protein FMN transferase [Fusobacterium sp. PH5-44]|uniref:FAD:protein FMN transferase n=1 Tax=unclassified Fusobacterium TaxID=2648384 RepID=UPI003D25A5D0
MQMKNRILKLFLFCVLVSFICFGDNSKEKKIEDERFLFGTYVKILIYDSDKLKAENAIKLAFDEIERIDKKYNSKVKNSIIFDLNNMEFINGKKSISIDEEGAYLLREVSKVYQLSNKKYDITISPLMSLWGFDEKVLEIKNIPNQDEIQNVIKKIDFDKLSFDEKQLTLESPVENIDTGSFLKGYAIFNASKILKEHGITSGFITSISSLSTIGRKSDGSSWRIGVQNPENSSEILGVLELQGEAIGISGDYQTYKEINGKKYHHILDKSNGFPISDKKMVVVVSDSCFLADIYSTGFFLMKIEDILSYVDKTENLEVLIVDSNNKIIKSKNIKFIKN